MSRIAWAAGLFEGEGCIDAQKHKGVPKYPRLTVLSTDLDVLETYKEIVEYGNINGPYDRFPEKNVYVWTICRKDEVSTIIYQFWPYLHARRRDAAIKIKHLLNERILGEEICNQYKTTIEQKASLASIIGLSDTGQALSELMESFSEDYLSLRRKKPSNT